MIIYKKHGYIRIAKFLLLYVPFFILFAQPISSGSLHAQGKKFQSPATNDHYYFISRQLQEFYSLHSISPSDYIATKKGYFSTINIFSNRLQNLKYIMNSIADLKIFIETTKISNFFEDKMKPFLEVENSRRLELISAIQDYIKRFPESPLTPYAILRYAELLYEKMSYEYILEYEKAIARGEPPPQKDFSPVVKVYENFLEKYKNFPWKDIVMYLAGYVLEEMGLSYEAVERYFEPLAKIRLSQFAPEAAMRAGEFWFNSGDLDKAEEYYLIVLDFPQHPLYPKALFKLAWTYYRKGDYKIAVDYFLESIDSAGESEIKAGVVQEAVEYMVAAVAELGGIKKLETENQRILSVLSKIYRDPEIFFFEAQGKAYFEQGKYQEAIETYKGLIDKHYNSPRSINGAIGILESLKKLGNIDDAVSWSVEIARRWGPTSQWAKSNPDTYKSYKAEIEKRLLESAKYFHSKNMLKEAEGSYKLFLELFPASEFSAEVQFLLGDLYYGSGDYLSAYAIYKANVQNIMVKENKYLLDAAWGLVLSADKSLNKGEKEAPELLKEASFMFEKLFPLDGRTPLALYKAAKVLSSEGKKRDALSILNKIIERYPGSEVVADCILEIIKIYVDENELEKVVDFSLQARKRVDILTPENITYINDLGAKALFKIAQKYENNKEYDKAVSYYLQIEKLYPSSDLIDDALYSAIMINNEIKKLNDVVSYSDIFLRKFPNSELRYDVLYVKANALANLLFFDDALTSYMKLIQELEKKEAEVLQKKQGLSQIERDMLKNSYKFVMNIYYGLAKYSEAAKWALNYKEKFGQTEPEPEYYIKLAADFYFDGKEFETAIKLLNEYISIKQKKARGKPTAETVLAKHKIASYYKNEFERSKSPTEKQELEKKYEKLLSEIIRDWDGLAAQEKAKVITAYSEAKFFFAKRTFEEYAKIRLAKTDNKKQLEKKLKDKTELMKKVQKEMTEIAQFGDPYWSFAALFYIGYSFQEFANMLIEAPVPPEIERIRDPEERELAIAIYKEELEKQAFPLEDSAIKTFSQSIEKIKQLGVRNEWTALIFKHLKMLDPLAPVEIEDDRIFPLNFSVSMRTSEMPAIVEETKTQLSMQKFSVTELVNFEKIRQKVTSNIGEKIFYPFFAYSENGKLKFYSARGEEEL